MIDKLVEVVGDVIQSSKHGKHITVIGFDNHGYVIFNDGFVGDVILGCHINKIVAAFADIEALDCDAEEWSRLFYG